MTKKHLPKKKFVFWFNELSASDVGLVGGKNASLGELISKLSRFGINVPNGFAITSDAYHFFLSESGIDWELKKLLTGLNPHDISDLRTRGAKLRELILNTELPNELVVQIAIGYEKLCELYGEKELSVAVRSSATAEDLPDASFAGQQDTFLNIRGLESVLEHVRRCFASLFNDRAISYREDKKFDHRNIAISVGIQKMVRSDLACAGVMFTLDTESGFRDVVLINSSYGLGENVVQGRVDPDEFIVFKPMLKAGKRAIIGKKLGTKKQKLIFGAGTERTINIEVSSEDRNRFVLSDREILELANWGCAIESHYGRPMDIEWAKDAETDKIFIVQARPETVHAGKTKSYIENYVLKERGRMLVRGIAIGSRIGRGEANIISDVKDIAKFRRGQVLVTDMTDPDWEPIMKMAAAIVTNRGGRTCHAAIVSRELGLPCIVGTQNATEIIKTYQPVTVSCTEGEIGVVYDGLLNFEIEKIDFAALPSTRTKLMMNIGIPEMAFTQCQIPNDGVGLARIEFIFNSYIGIHPLALINFGELEQRARFDRKIEEIVNIINSKTLAYPSKTDFFIENLAMGIGKIAAAFYPREVIVRFSDFKTNEYANLVGGYLYEPVESNPMIGWRGASRYYDPKFRPAFELECKAIKVVREEMGFTNVKAMVPFCRTVEEGKKVIEIMESVGLKRGVNNFEVYVMAEIPSNIIAAEQFAEIFDGFSIGSNDLTQLTLGLDRDSEILGHLSDERNIAVKRLIEQLIKVAHRKKRKVGICGQAPSDYAEFAEFLVDCGIDSISLNPDTMIKTRLKIAEKERSMKCSKQ